MKKVLFGCCVLMLAASCGGGKKKMDPFDALTKQIDSLAVYITHKCLARQGLKDFAEIAGGDKDVPGR